MRTDLSTRQRWRNSLEKTYFKKNRTSDFVAVLQEVSDIIRTGGSGLTAERTDRRRRLVPDWANFAPRSINLVDGPLAISP